MDWVGMGKRIRIARHIADMTQERLAAEAGVCTSYIGHIERGTRKVSLEVLWKLCRVLGVKMDWVAGE